ncbi:MAG: zinc ABC transporter substrate-binding protein [Lachnospiraceae bacterium]|nr:zinc ABC transporter substrate-binding protein [Lachnospiraceae bacterium]
MKRFLYTVFIMVFSMGIITGCGAQNVKDDRISIVCTTFPQYDWVREIIGEHEDRFDITYLLESGVDIHSYQPTAMDIAKITDCDLLIYLGGESEEWVEEVITQNANSDMQVIEMMECLGDAVKPEVMVEGMQHDHVHHDGEHCDIEEHHHDEDVYDEHVWLSLRNAGVLTEHITAAIMTLDAEYASEYEINANTYLMELENLDAAYEEAVAQAKTDTVLFADRFPFRYLLDDYAINYYAAFIGCSAETEASFETVAFLAEKLDELSLQHVLILEKSDTRLADSIIKNAESGNQDVLVLNSIQSVSKTELSKGVTYLGLMQENLQILKTALN